MPRHHSIALMWALGALAAQPAAATGPVIQPGFTTPKSAVSLPAQAKQAAPSASVVEIGGIQAVLELAPAGFAVVRDADVLREPGVANAHALVGPQLPAVLTAQVKAADNAARLLWNWYSSAGRNDTAQLQRTNATVRIRDGAGVVKGTFQFAGCIPTGYAIATGADGQLVAQVRVTCEFVTM
jgi:hypothetical protein